MTSLLLEVAVALALDIPTLFSGPYLVASVANGTDLQVAESQWDKCPWLAVTTRTEEPDHTLDIVVQMQQTNFMYTSTVLNAIRLGVSPIKQAEVVLVGKFRTLIHKGNSRSCFEHTQKCSEFGSPRAVDILVGRKFVRPPFQCTRLSPHPLMRLRRLIICTKLLARLETPRRARRWGVRNILESRNSPLLLAQMKPFQPTASLVLSNQRGNRQPTDISQSCKLQHSPVALILSAELLYSTQYAR